MGGAMFRRGDDRGEDERHERQERHERHERHEPIQPKEVGMAEGARQGGGAGSEVTVVGQGARIEGTLVSAGSLRIDGQVKGKIKAEGDVTLSPQSTVDADIQAQNVTVAGAFKGNITSKVLVVAEGAVFAGQSIMGEAASRPAPPADGAPPAEE